MTLAAMTSWLAVPGEDDIFAGRLQNGSASTTERTIACPSWLALPHVGRSDRYSARGHGIHGYQRAILAGVAKEIALLAVPEAA
jgi:hypothetical protein